MLSTFWSWNTKSAMNFSQQQCGWNLEWVLGNFHTIHSDLKLLSWKYTKMYQLEYVFKQEPSSRGGVGWMLRRPNIYEQTETPLSYLILLTGSFICIFYEGIRSYVIISLSNVCHQMFQNTHGQHIQMFRSDERRTIDHGCHVLRPLTFLLQLVS